MTVHIRELPILAWDSFRDLVLWFCATLLRSGRCRRRRVFIHSVSALAAKLTYADGKVCERELAVLHKHMDYDYARRWAPHQRTRVQRAFQAAARSPREFQDYAMEVYEAFGEYPELLMNILKALFELVAADGIVHPRERLLLQDAVHVFGFKPSVFDYLISQYSEEERERVAARRAQARARERAAAQEARERASPPPPPRRRPATLARHYAILELDPDCAPDEVKSAYRRLVKEYHPDRIASLGLPKGFTEFAGQKFREIQGAYEAIRQQPSA